MLSFTKLLVPALLGLAMAAPAAAQGEGTLESKLEQKLAKPFVAHGNWILDYDEARKIAKEEGKLIFVYFTRSYSPWPPCNTLESGALSSEEFPAFTNKVVPYLHITTRIEGRKDEELFRDKGGKGFPTMKFLDADGNVMGEPNGRDVASFETSLDRLMVINKLEERIANGEKGLENELFLAKMRLGLLKHADAKAQFASLKGLTKEQKVEITEIMINLEVTEIMNGVDSDEAAVAAGAQFHKMLEEGVIPTGDALGAYWSLIMTYAESESDADLFERSLNALKEKYGAEESAKPFFDQKAAVLKKMREDVTVGS